MEACRNERNSSRVNLAMRILVLTQVVPFPPDSGPKVKTLNVLRYLAQRHDVHLVSFARSTKEVEQAAVLRRYCCSVTTVPLRRSRARDATSLARSLITGRPFLVERDDSRAMRAATDALLAQYQIDAVHADQFSMAQFAVDLPVRLRVLDEHNAVWTIIRRAAQREPWGPWRIAAEVEWRKVRAYEGAMCRRFDRVTVVSPEDQRALEGAAGGPFPTEVIPIAVDTTALLPEPRGARARHVVSVATMFYPPNAEGVYWFARNIFPAIRQTLPETEFHVVGSRPPTKVKRLAQGQDGVHVRGYVPDLSSVWPYAGVLVVPVHSGSGMRVKILEAFARGIPVVSTTIGVEGIDARDGEHLLVADDPGQFAAAVIRLLREPATAARLAAAARSLVEERYDWRNALAGLDRVYAPGAASSPTLDLAATPRTVQVHASQ